jgi:hypothetical protein
VRLFSACSLHFSVIFPLFLGLSLVEKRVLGNRRVRVVGSLRLLALPLPRVGHRSRRRVSHPSNAHRHPSSSATMSGLKNSPFGKRLRAAHQDTDDDTPRRNRQRVIPAFALTPPTVPVSIPSLNYSQLTASDTPGPESPEHPSRAHGGYRDRFVPSRDTGDMRTSYHLRDDSGPSTPSKHRTIPTESDAIKGAFVLPLPVAYLTRSHTPDQNKPTPYSTPSFTAK